MVFAFFDGFCNFCPWDVSVSYSEMGILDSFVIVSVYMDDFTGEMSDKVFDLFVHVGVPDVEGES